MSWISRMHEDGDGHPSNMRVMVSITVVSCLVHAFVYPAYSTFSFGLVAAALGFKYGQARIE